MSAPTMTADQIDRLKVLSDARHLAAGLERVMKTCPTADFFVICHFNSDDGGTVESGLKIDIATARLILPHVRRVIDAEYEKLLDALPRRPRKRNRRAGTS
jgi:hypothetical protein